MRLFARSRIFNKGFFDEINATLDSMKWEFGEDVSSIEIKKQLDRIEAVLKNLQPKQ